MDFSTTAVSDFQPGMRQVERSQRGLGAFAPSRNAFTQALQSPQSFGPQAVDPVRQASQPLGLDSLNSAAAISRSFELSATRTEFAVQTPELWASGYSESVSFHATLLDGDRQLDVTLEVTRSVVQVATTQLDAMGGFEELLARLEDEFPTASEGASGWSDSPLSALIEQFSPQATAGRIADFVVRGYDRFGRQNGLVADDRNRRQHFVDEIGPSIERGKREALALLGELPKRVMDEIDTTSRLLEERLAAFVAAGPDDASPATNDEQGARSPLEVTV